MLFILSFSIFFVCLAAILLIPCVIPLWDSATAHSPSGKELNPSSQEDAVFQEVAPWYTIFTSSCVILLQDSAVVSGKASEIKAYWDNYNNKGLCLATSPNHPNYINAVDVLYFKSLADVWNKQLKLLSIIAESEPQSAYSAFVGGFKEKLTYFMRTTPPLGKSLKSLEDVIRFNFIPAITGGHLCSDNERILLFLPVTFGGVAIPLFHNDAKYVFENSRKLTSSLTQLIKDQYQIYSVNETEQKSIKLNIKINKEE